MPRTLPDVLLTLASAFYLFVVIACVTSCAATSPFLKNKRTGLPLYQCQLPQLVVVTSDVPFEDLLMIKNSIDYWNTELGRVPVSKISSSPPLIYAGVTNFKSRDTPKNINYIVVRVLPESEAEAPISLGNMERFVNYTKGCIKGAIISYFRNRLKDNPNKMNWVMRHEIGHSIGLSHSSFKGDLMYESTFTSPSFIPRATKRQIRALKNIYNIKD